MVPIGARIASTRKSSWASRRWQRSNTWNGKHVDNTLNPLSTPSAAMKPLNVKGTLAHSGVRRQPGASRRFGYHGFSATTLRISKVSE